MRVLVSSRARKDLLQIFAYLAQRNPTAAEAALARIDAKLSQLSQFPFIGRRRFSLARGLRSAVVGQHLIFYTVNKTTS
jgi:toxin ParE1/3/4